MKLLYFHATAGHPKITLPFMAQAGKVLRPFNRFLEQAIHTAKQRQFRYNLPWERVRNQLTTRLDPLDSLLRVPRRSPGIILSGWSSDMVPDFGQMGFVMNRGVPVRFETATPIDNGLLVRADVPLLTTDRVIWCGVESTVRQEAPFPPPHEVTDLHGCPVKLLAEPRADDDRHWLLLVEGIHGHSNLVVDGEEVEVEVVPVFEGLRHVIDQNTRSYEVSGGMLKLEEPLADEFLRGDNGVRFHWHEVDSSGRRGCWVHLLPRESPEADELLDPRASFCEGDVSEVWSAPRYQKETSFRVKKVDQDRYQLLLDRYPPEGSILYLPVNLRNLYLQKRAQRQLSEAPLPHHQGLLRLCGDPLKTRWSNFQPVEIRDDGWRALIDLSRSGTDEQRSFVCKALGSPDFAFLEGPPGSGKTTAICEIVQQLVEKGQRVLLCASTHVAIDNVLERLLESGSPIDAVRIGKIDRVDDKVQVTQLNERVGMLISKWRNQSEMQNYGDAELKEMAQRTVIMASNLTCGTTMGIVRHPLFEGRDEDMRSFERPISTMPHWDVLIVDEASKTLIQEFLVPALMAKRWIIVGDVRQLPPFTERADIVANLRDLVDETDKMVFPADHQRACLLMFRLLRGQVRQLGMRWLLVERPGVLECIIQELKAGRAPDLNVVRISIKGGSTAGPVKEVTVNKIRAGNPEALHLAAADWVLVCDDVIVNVVDLLPSNMLAAKDLTGPGLDLHEGNVFLTRQNWWFSRAGTLQSPYRDKEFQYRQKKEQVGTFADSQSCEADWIGRHDLAQEIAWRLTRLHELRYSRNERERKRLRKDLGDLQPLAVSIKEPIAEIEDIGLPSILEVLQEGIGEERANRPSALTVGLKPDIFDSRSSSLSFQHRMHPEIVSFSRDVIYEGKSLKDANTIQIRDSTLGWDFGQFRSRRVWANIDGSEQGGVNTDEVWSMAGVLRDFIAWTRKKGPPARLLPHVWEVACLCFYVKQERAISDMLREVTQDEDVRKKTRFQVRDSPIEVVCGTVDRFQGREADLVMLSMRNTRRIGFLDSPNRLNVAVTRARQQLVIFGKHDYFSNCQITELEELARRTPLVEEQDVRRWRRRTG